MMISKFKSKQLLIITLITSAILLGVHVYAFSVLYPQFKAQFSQFILNSWLLGMCVVIAVYGSARMQKLRIKAHKYFYKLLYMLFYDHKHSCMFLSNDLDILYVNNNAQKSFCAHYKKISKIQSGFSLSKLEAGRLNFAEICPNTKIKKIVANMTQAAYSNKLNYGTLEFTFKIRKIEVLGICLGFIVLIKFVNTPIKSNDQHYDRMLLENLRLKMLNLMLDNDSPKNNSEYLNLYNNINNIINTKKLPVSEVSRNHL